MNFFVIFFVLFFPKSLLASNIKEILTHPQLKMEETSSTFDSLPLDIQKKILNRELDTLKNTSLVSKHWNKIITLDSAYKPEKLFTLRLHEIKNAFNEKKFLVLQNAIQLLITDLNLLNSNIFIEEPSLKDEISSNLSVGAPTTRQKNSTKNSCENHNFYFVDQEIKKILIKKRINPRINKLFHQILTSLYSQDNFNTYQTYQIINSFLKIPSLEEKLIQRIFNLFFSTNKIQKNSSIILNPIKSILIHPHCTIDILLDLFSLTFESTIDIFTKQATYEGLSEQKLTNNSALTLILENEDFWDYEHFSLTEEQTFSLKMKNLMILVNLFIHPSVASDNPFKNLAWAKTLSTFNNLISLVSSYSQAFEIFEHIQKLSFHHQLELINVLLKNDNLKDLPFKNEIYQFIRDLILDSNDFDVHMYDISNTIAHIADESIVFPLIKEIILKMNSFKSQMTFFGNIFYSLKDKYSMNFESYFPEEIFPIFSFESQNQQNIFLFKVYNSLNYISAYEIKRFLDFPITSHPSYFLVLKILLDKAASQLSLEDSQKIFEKIKEYTQKTPNNVQIFILGNFYESFFKHGSNSFLINQALQTLNTFGDNPNSQVYALYMLANLDQVSPDSHPLLEEMIFKLKNKNTRSTIMKILTEKVNLAEIQNITELTSLLNTEDIKNFQDFVESAFKE